MQEYSVNIFKIDERRSMSAVKTITIKAENKKEVLSKAFAEVRELIYQFRLFFDITPSHIIK